MSGQLAHTKAKIEEISSGPFADASTVEDTDALEKLLGGKGTENG